MSEPEPLPDDLLEYLDAAREPEPVPSATKARLLASLGPFLPPSGGGGGSPGGDAGGTGGDAGAAGSATGGTATAAGAASGLLKGKLVVATVSAMIGAMGGAAMHATFAPPKTIVVAAPAVSVAAPIERGPLPSVAPPTAELPVESAVVVAPSATSAPSDVPAVRKSSMRAERVLLEAANAALMRGDYATALASLQQHKQSYPRGELAPERDILIAQATKLKAADKK